MATTVLERERVARERDDEFLGRSPWQLFWLRFRADRVALAALAFIVLLIAAAALGGPITRAFGHPPSE